ncbi:MAG: ABC transporter permease [Spirochaetota bacterium]
MFGRRSNLVVLVITLVIVILVMSVFLPDKFLTLINFQSMTSQFPEFGLLAIGMMLAMISGGIDLSVVSITNFTGVLTAIVLKSYTGEAGTGVSTVIFLAIMTALAVSALCGMVNGTLISQVGVPPILATLGTQGLFLGLAIVITEGHGIHTFPTKFLFIGSGTIGALPMPLIIFIACILLVSLLLKKTTLGLNMYMVGSNPVAARFSGIDNNRVLLKTYMIIGLLAGVSSLIMISRVNSIRPGYGYAYLLQAILVPVLGGTNPYGGSGSVLGVVIAIILLQLLQSGFNILAFSPFFRKFIWGMMLVLIMVINYVIQYYQKRGKKIKPQEVQTADEAGSK